MRLDPHDPAGQTGDGEPLGFVWLGARPALDLCNTRLGCRELLAAPPDLARWLLEARLAERRPIVTRADLGATISLRDGLRDTLLAGDEPGLASLAGGWLDGAPGRLSVEERTLEPRFTPGARTARCALVGVVLDALELARDSPGRVRECACEQCPVVYLDTSRNRSRRWCSMELCGARAKSTAYYQRHRGC